MDTKVREETIQRLRLEKAEHDEQHNEEYKTAGFEYGYENCEKLSYEQIRGESDLSSFWRNEVLELEGDLDDEFDGDSYCEGYFDGVRAFWEEVKDQI